MTSSFVSPVIEAPRINVSVVHHPESREFLEILFGGKPDNLFVLLWLLRSKSSHWFTDLDRAAQFAEAHSAEDVYVGCVLSLGDFGPHQRLKLDGERLPAGLVALYADIDLAGTGHNPTKPYPNTIKEAMSIIPADAPPSILIGSGHGAQAWWILREPWIFSDDAERARAAALEARWLALLQARAATKGWTLDSVQDLTRVLRIPGTTNCKVQDNPVPVTILQRNEIRYNVSDLEELLVGMQVPVAVLQPPAAPAQVATACPGGLVLDPAANPPADKFELLSQVEPRFLRSWNHDRPDLKDQSASSYDQSLADYAALAQWTDEEITELLIAHRKKHNADLKRPDYYQRTIRKARETAANAGAGRSESQPAEAGAPAQDPGLRFYPYTDSGNAERLTKIHGANIRYCHPTKTWWVWNRQRWEPDRTGRMMHFAKCIARDLHREASELEDSSARKACADWARRSESSDKKRAAIESARSESDIPVLMNQFDADPWLLSVLNGTLDLRNGELRPHRREDLITKAARVHHDPAARSELWERFLREATGGDRELSDFLQRAVGYSLTGDTREEVLFLIHGEGATGKSSFLEAIKAVLGTYSKTSDFETFIQRRDAGAVRNDVAELAGHRFIVSIEVDEGRKLAEGLVKQLTGRDTVRARFLYQESFEFTPQGKFWLCANHAPRVKDDDSALWRRIVKVPFDCVIPENRQDPSLKARLKDPSESGAAILNWALEGCHRWQEEGLMIPVRVKAATEQLREEMDPIRDFLNDLCVMLPNQRVGVSLLRKEYEEWARDNGIKCVLDAQGFNERLKARGCTQDRGMLHGKRSRIWVGITLRTEQE